MLKQLSALLVALFLALAAFVWVETYSSSFQDCISHTVNNPGVKDGQNKVGATVVVPLSYIRCTERFADRHNALITAFATGLGAMGLFGWRRKRKSTGAIAAA